MIISNTRPKIYVSKSQRVYYPGNNLVNKEEIEAADVAALIEAKIFVVISEQATVEKAAGLSVEKSEAKAIKRMEVDPAIEAIKGLLNIKTLRELLVIDDRMEITEAIEDQLRILTDHREDKIKV